MDQVKEILKQAIKYRFWIALGVSLLFPAIAYFVGAGPIQKEAADKTTEIKGAKTEVEKYANGVLPNKQYKGIVDGKTAELSTDVIKSHKKLYARQAPLLAWPERVHERFTTWGRKWPEGVDASAVQNAIIDYVTIYNRYVTEIYNTFKPFDFESGNGVVVAPPEKTLLRPAPFDENKLPDLGKVWAAQERLWIQRSLLEVVAEVNKNAKAWDNAVVREIKVLEVGASSAQDQVSIVSGDTTAAAEPITDPKAPPAATTSTESAPGAMSMMGMGMGGKGDQPEVVYYLNPAGGATTAPYKIMPVEMAVLVEQDRIQDYLSALENSPMSIQVKEVSVSKPTERVVKPEKGEGQGGYGGYGGQLMIRRPMGRLTGFGGMQSRMPMMGPGPGPRGMGGPTGAAGGRKGVDKRGTDNRKKKDEEGKEDDSKPKRPPLHDPYFNIVEVTFYGQVRFYNPPPPEPPAEPATASPGEAAADAKPADADKPAAEPTKDAEAKDEAKKDEAPAEKDKAEPANDDEMKKDDAKKDEGDAAKKDDAAKPEEPAKDKDGPAPKGDETPKKDAEPAPEK